MSMPNLQDPRTLLMPLNPTPCTLHSHPCTLPLCTHTPEPLTLTPPRCTHTPEPCPSALTPLNP